MKQFPSLARCRLSRKQLVRLLTPVLAFSPVVNAADVFKANNADALNLTTSWTSGALPTATDVAVFDSTVTDIPLDLEGYRSVILPAAASWQGIRVAGAVDKISINSNALGVPPLTIGSAGLDFSAATSGTIFDFYAQTLTLGEAQTWSVADGATVQFTNVILSRAQGATVKLNLGATGTGVVNPSATFGAANAILAYATIGGADFAAVNATQSALVPGNTLGTYTANPNTGATVTNFGSNTANTYSVIDVINSNTYAATAFRYGATGGLTAAGVRFNQPHTTAGTAWVVDTAGRNLNIGNGGILVTANVGARDVRFDGTGNLRMGNSSELYVHQDNPAGNLIINANINTANPPATNNVRLTKSGAGRLVLTSNGNNGQGVVTINEGSLQVGNNGATGQLGTAAAPVNNKASLIYNRTDAYTVANVISGSGQFTHAGSGTLTLSGANTFTGAVNLNAGTLAFAVPANLGAGTQVNFNGGALQWAAANTTDISSRTLLFNAGGSRFDTNGGSITLANSVGGGGAGGLTKLGAGTLTLSGANNFSGSSTVSAGVLSLANTSGSATGTGAVAVANGGTLGGTGSASGVVSVAFGGKVAPGVGGVGSLAVGGLNLVSGAVLDLEFASTSSNDRIVVGNTDGLSIAGGSVNVYSPGGTTAYTEPGTYNLIQYNGVVGGTGASALSVLNPQAGFSYSFGTASGFVTLTIAQLGQITQWTATGSGGFESTGNWSNGVPTGSGATANFTTALSAPATIALNGSRTLAGLAFDSSPNGYTVVQGTGAGVLTLANGASDVAINVTAGAHAITAPVTVSSNLAVSTSASSSLAISGAVSGTGNVVKSGPGSLVLSGTNALVGSTTVAGGTLEFGSLASIGDGAITLNGGVLRYGTGNTADISGRSITIGANGGTIDTNGNDVSFAAGFGNAGGGGFTKAGAGTLTLSLASNYAGSTTIAGGTISIAADTALNDIAAGVILDGGTLATTASFTTNRGITVGASGGGLKVETGTTLTVGSALAGTGTLTKSGAGGLVLNAGSTLTGPVNLTEGSITTGVGGAAGSGTITMSDGTTFTPVTLATTFIGNPVALAPGATATMISTNITGAYNGAVSGDATSKLVIGGTTQFNFGAANSQQLSGFLGTCEIAAGAFARFSSTNLVNGGQNTTFNVLGSLTSRNNGTVHLGKLTGLGTITGSASTDGQSTNYSIGAKNEDSTFGGAINDSDTALGRRSAVTKVGTGTLTLNGVSAYTGVTNVNVGNLRVDGTLGATTVTVAAAATLSGAGTIAGPVTVNGILRPDALGSAGGRLTFNGTLSLAGTTQFDFNGTTFTGVSAPNGGLTYGGALKINYLGTVSSGSFILFQTTGAPSGAFTGGVSVVADAVETALTDVGGGVYSATVGAVTYTFTAATGAFDVSGAGPSLTALQSWRQQYSLPVDGSGLGADSADPDNDGIANLIEYATGTVPTSFNAPSVVQGLSGGKLTLTFNRIDDPSLTYTVEGRDDLTTGAWATVVPTAGNNPTTGFTGTNPAATETVSETVIDTVTLGTQPKRFLHLKVSYPTAP